MVVEETMKKLENGEWERKTANRRGGWWIRICGRI
jgi:hypothetical protein